jgi:dihydrofolate synthase/folylpolyglutamate synthase
MSSSLTERLIALYGREEMKKETGLSRITRALGNLIPELSQKKIITIAGTNGKGETTLWLSHELGTRPHCVWISPHVERITERFRSEEGEIDETELETLVDHCHELVIKNGFELTFYEFLFFVFCHWARKKNPDVLLLEVGLGGRLDAVNVFDADFVLLPSISRDHQEFLGKRYDQILKEKLALLRPGKTLVSFLSLTYLQERTQLIVKAVGAKSLELDSLKLAPAWDFSRRNQLLARAAFLLLEGHENVTGSLRNFETSSKSLEHRGERLRERGEWIFYGSHNVDGMRNLIQFLMCGNYNLSRPPIDAVLVAFSRRDTRDISAMLKILKKSGAGEIVVTCFPHPKAASPEMMEELAHLEGIKFVHDPEAYIQTSEDRRTLVTGSYYFIGYLKELLRGR